jgi:hypothetical protein
MNEFAVSSCRGESIRKKTSSPDEDGGKYNCENVNSKKFVTALAIAAEKTRYL